MHLHTFLDLYRTEVAMLHTWVRRLQCNWHQRDFLAGGDGGISQVPLIIAPMACGQIPLWNGSHICIVEQLSFEDRGQYLPLDVSIALLHMCFTDECCGFVSLDECCIQAILQGFHLYHDRPANIIVVQSDTGANELLFSLDCSYVVTVPYKFGIKMQHFMQGVVCIDFNCINGTRYVTIPKNSCSLVTLVGHDTSQMMVTLYDLDGV